VLHLDYFSAAPLSDVGESDAETEKWPSPSQKFQWRALQRGGDKGGRPYNV